METSDHNSTSWTYYISILNFLIFEILKTIWRFNMSACIIPDAYCVSILQTIIKSIKDPL